MTLSKERKPLRSRRIVSQRASSKIVYGNEIPISRAICINIPVTKSICKENMFTLFVEYNSGKKEILHSHSYNEFKKEIDSICLLTTRGMLLCYNVIVHSCIDIPLGKVFKDNLRFNIGDTDFNIDELKISTQNGITVLHDRIQNKINSNERLKLNVDKDYLLEVSKVFANTVLEENNAFLSTHH